MSVKLIHESSRDLLFFSSIFCKSVAEAVACETQWEVTSKGFYLKFGLVGFYEVDWRKFCLDMEFLAFTTFLDNYHLSGKNAVLIRGF